MALPGEGAVDVTAIRAVADRLERLSLRKSAAELRAAIERAPDERPCVIQEAQGGQVRAIPWGLAERLYVAYRHDQTLERMAERGGFSRRELGMLAVGMYSGNKQIRGPFQRSFPLLDLYVDYIAALGAGGES